MTEDQKEKFAQEKQRLLQNNSLILATVDTEGRPLASSTPFVTKGENFYIFISNKTRCAFRIKKSKLITYHNDMIQFSPKNQNNE